MSHHKQYNNHTKINNNNNNNQYPLIKQPYNNNMNNMNKLNNQQRLKQVYKSTSIKQKTKPKYYLPIKDNKNIQKHIHSINQNKPNRYKQYLQQEQTQKHYIRQQQHHQRYQPKTTRLYHHKLQQSSQTRKIDVSSNLQIKTHFRRKLSKQIPNQNQSITSRKRQSAQILQNQLNQLNQNIHNGKRNNHNNNGRYFNNKNSMGIDEQQQRKSSTRYNNHNDGNSGQQTQYQKEMFKIRKSTKKSYSGSLSKKPSENNIREDSKMDNINNNNISNSGGIKSQFSSPKYHPLLQQGKKYIKQNNLQQAIKTFLKGKQQQPKNLQFSYNIALVYLKCHQYQQGLKQLQEILEVNEKFKKTVYLFAVISLRHMNLLQKAIQMANKGLRVFGDNNKEFVDLIFYRGKLYKQVGNIDMALKDMLTVTSIQKDHIQALYYTAFIYYQQQLITNTMSTLSAAIYYDQNKHSQMRLQALKLRAKIYLSEGKIKDAKKDIQKVIQKIGGSVEMHYLMGKVLIMEHNITDGLIHFQKALREKTKIGNNNSKTNKQPPSSQTKNSLFPQTNPTKYLIPSLLQICKTKIDMKDFYSAYHHINRYKHLQSLINQHNLSLLRFKYFIEGVVFLMKRKIDQGMKNFQKFIQIQGKIKEKLMNSHNKQSATITKGNAQVQQQYSELQIFECRQLQSEIRYFYPSFNLYRGFGYFMQNKHHLAIKDYEEYQSVESMDKYTTYNMMLAKGIDRINERQFQNAIEYFNKAGMLFTNTQTKKIQPYIYRAIASIQTARQYHIKNNNNSNDISSSNNPSHNRQKQDNQNDQQNNDIKVLQLVFDALKQLDKAYDLNDANSNLLFIRSLIYAYLGKYQESLLDIIKGISKSQENVPKYFFFRGLIQSTLENKKQAMNDFNIAINLDNNYASVYFQRSKLNFTMESYTKAFQDLAKYSELRPQQDEQFHKAALYLVNGIYPMAEETCQLIKNKQSEEYKQLRFHILLRLGKINQVYELITQNNETDRSLLKIIQNHNLNELFNNNNNNSDNILINPHTLSQQKIKYFNPIQYYHFLGVAYFNLNQYDRALEQFTIALKQCNLRDMEKGASVIGCKKYSTQQQSDQSNKNLGDKDANCIVYNIFLCHLKLNDLRKAYEIFIKQIMPVDQKLQKSQFMANFSHLLFQSMKQSSSIIKQKKSSSIKQKQRQLQQQQQQENDNVQYEQKQRQATQDKQQAHVQLFTNSITDMFSKEIVIQMSTFLLRTKLSYLNVECERLKREYGGKLWPQYVLTWLNVKQVENRPQPPWVKRLSSMDQGLVFTDQVQNINIEFQTTQHDEQDEQQEQQEQQGSQQQQDNQGSSNQQQSQQQNNNQSQISLKKRFDPRKFRDQMKLGDSIQRKLNKIVNKNNNN